MRYHIHELDGVKTQLAWDRNAYLAAIADAENLITPRRVREALTTEAGANWLRAIEAEIVQLRSELAAI